MARLGVLGILGLGALAACETGGPCATGDDGLAVCSGSATSVANDDGLAIASIEVYVDGHDSVLVTVAPDDGYLAYVHGLVDPSGDRVLDAESLWADATHFRTMGVFPDSSATLNWPIDSSDGGSLAKGWWTVEIGTVDFDYYYVDNVGVELSAHEKKDDEFDGGSMVVDLVYTGATADDTELQAAMDEATAYWQEIYAGIGIDVAFESYTYGDGNFGAPGEADAHYTAIAETTPVRHVNVVILEDMDNGDGLYGLAGGIPGPLAATGRSGVAINALVNSGSDLTFDDDEITILGETLAHEVGHFTGLFHPVETTYDLYDAVSDTEECSSQNDCIDRLGTNLMFPYPVCYNTGCLRQDELTAGQAEITNRYVGVE